MAAMVSLTKWLLRRTAPAWDVDVRADEVRFPAIRQRRARVVRIDRSLCRPTFSRRAAGVRFRDESKAVAMRARATAPFHNPQFAVVWGRETVGIFYWDADRIARLLADAKVELAADHVFLPSHFFDQPGDGFEVRQRENGFEAQLWSGSELRISRWWNGQPTEEQVAAFRLAGDIGDDVALKFLPQTRLADRALALDSRTACRHPFLYRRHVYAGLLLCNLLFAAYAGGALLRLAGEEARIAGLESRARSANGDIPGSRKRAIENQRWLTAYRAQSGGREQLSVMTTFFDVLESVLPELTISQWDYDKGQLSVMLIVAKPVDIKDVVRRLEDHELFEAVNSESNVSPNAMKLVMTVKR